jgi:hypothetical protein
MPDTRYIGPVQAIEIYAKDVVVVRRGLCTKPEGTKRGEVKEFSEASRKRLAFVASNTSVTFRTMITLTYPKEFPGDGETVKKHLRRFLTWLQRDTGGCDYLWFFEFQQRGAPHIHILIDWPMPRDRDGTKAVRFRVAASWYRFASSGDAKHLKAGTRVEALRSPEGGAHYAVKYASKMRQKIVPKGFEKCGRFWGHTRRVKPEPLDTFHCTEDDVRGTLEGWQYAPPEDRPVYRVLYNQADRFVAWRDQTEPPET